MIMLRKIFGLLIALGLLLSLSLLGSACNEGEGHENMASVASENSLTGMAVGVSNDVGEIEDENSSAHQILEVMLGINSIFLNVLIGAGIYWLVKSAKSK